MRTGGVLRAALAARPSRPNGFARLAIHRRPEPPRLPSWSIPQGSTASRLGSPFVKDFERACDVRSYFPMQAQKERIFVRSRGPIAHHLFLGLRVGGLRLQTAQIEPAQLSQKCWKSSRFIPSSLASSARWLHGRGGVSNRDEPLQSGGPGAASGEGSSPSRASCPEWPREFEILRTI